MPRNIPYIMHCLGEYHALCAYVLLFSPIFKVSLIQHRAIFLAYVCREGLIVKVDDENSGAFGKMWLRAATSVPGLPSVNELDSLISTNVVIVMIMSCDVSLNVRNPFDEVITCCPTGNIFVLIPSSFLSVPYVHEFHRWNMGKYHSWHRLSM